eukprot:6579209-Pyramimonas_sp.AAC.2
MNMRTDTGGGTGRRGSNEIIRKKDSTYVRVSSSTSFDMSSKLALPREGGCNLRSSKASTVHRRARCARYAQSPPSAHACRPDPTLPAFPSMVVLLLICS